MANKNNPKYLQAGFDEESQTESNPFAYGLDPSNESSVFDGVASTPSGTKNQESLDGNYTVNTPSYTASPTIRGASTPLTFASPPTSLPSGYTFSPTLTPTSVTSSCMTINLCWGTSVNSAPTGFTAAIIHAAQILESYIYMPNIGQPITVNLAVGWGEAGNYRVASGAAYGEFIGNSSYNFIQNNISYTHAEAQAKGLESLGNYWDGCIGFGNTTSLYYLTGLTSTYTVPSTKWDIMGPALHELTHALGRCDAAWSDIGTYMVNTTGLLATNKTIYKGFTIDGGVTFLNLFSNVSDPGDWAGYSIWNSLFPGKPMLPDMADASTPLGVALNTLSFSDLVEMSLLGYQMNASAVTMSSGYMGYVIDSIQARLDLVSSISLYDSTVATSAVSISASQSVADAAALSKVIGTYNLQVLGGAGSDTLWDTSTSRATMTGGWVWTPLWLRVPTPSLT